MDTSLVVVNQDELFIDAFIARKTSYPIHQIILSYIRKWIWQMLLHTRGSDLVHGLLDNVRNTNLGVAVSWVNTHFAYFFATQKLPYESIWIKIFKVYIYDILLHIFSSLKFTRILQCVSRQGVKCFFKMISSKLFSNLCWFFLLDLFLKGLPKPFESCLLEDRRDDFH